VHVSSSNDSASTLKKGSSESNSNLAPISEADEMCIETPASDLVSTRLWDERLAKLPKSGPTTITDPLRLMLCFLNSMSADNQD